MRENKRDKAKQRTAGYCLKLKPDHRFSSAGRLSCLATVWLNGIFLLVVQHVGNHLPLCLLFKTVKMSQIKVQLSTSTPSESATTQRSSVCCLWLVLLCLHDSLSQHRQAEGLRDRRDPGNSIINIKMSSSVKDRKYSFYQHGTLFILMVAEHVKLQINNTRAALLKGTSAWGILPHS